VSQPLQRVVVRMLYDPTFVLAVYDDAAAATADVDLTDAQRGWLTRPDRRAWTIDRERRARTLAALIDEYPATTAAGDSVDAFFSSPRFHRAIQNRESLAPAYGDFLVEYFGTRAWVSALARLERAIALLRRRSPLHVGAGQVVLGPQVEPHVGPQHLSAAYQAARTRQPLPPYPTTGATEELLAELQPDGSIGLGGGSPELVTLLEAARRPVAVTRLHEVAGALGCNAQEARELVEELAAEGLLALGA